MSEWYYKVSLTDKIQQGQILLGCPIQVTEFENDEIISSTYNIDVIVLTQSCDLANGKVENVVVAELIDIPVTGMKKQDRNTIKQINDNNRPRYHLIKSYCDDKFNMEAKLVDFGSIYTIPINYLSLVRKSIGDSIALKSPYREFVSQRFGSFFARIGLPDRISDEELDSYIEKVYDEER